METKIIEVVFADDGRLNSIDTKNMTGPNLKEVVGFLESIRKQEGW